MKISTRLLLIVGVIALGGCVERKLTVRSDPPGAMVYLDEQLKGYTPVTFKFHFYGHRTFRLNKRGYRTYEEVRHVEAPWWQWPVISIFADLQPFALTNAQEVDVTMEPHTDVPHEVILDRAKVMKTRLGEKPETPDEETQPETPAEEEPAEN